MKRLSVLLVLCIGLLATPASGKSVGVSASPNPARLGDRVRLDLSIGLVGRLDVWVSANGFERPGSGTLPVGTWTFECCPSQTAGTPAWHYRSSSAVASGSYRFTATARARGSFLSTALVAGQSASVRVTVR
jgi:hypothetical protein